MDAYTEVGGSATQDAKAEVIGTTPWTGKVELCLEQQSRVESGTETENDSGRLQVSNREKTSGNPVPDRAEDAYTDIGG